MVVFSKSKGDVTVLKKRRILGSTYPDVYFGDCGIILKCAIRFEFSYFFYMRKFIKKVIKKRKGFTKSKKIWVFVRPNQILSKKTKNARMGKGKGRAIRWCSLLPKGFTLLHVRGIPIVRLRKYVIRLQNRFKFPLQVSPNTFITSKHETQRLLGTKNTVAVYF
jgi:ribosomal protein L16/L10AE